MNFLGASEGAVTQEGEAPISNLAVVEEAVQALAVLGFAPAPTQKIVKQIVKDDPNIPVEGIIKKALKML